MVATVDEIKSFLSNPGNLAIVGASSKESKAGYYVPKYLQSIGFNILPINPELSEFLGKPCYNNLRELEGMDLKGIIIYRRNPEAETQALMAVEMKIPMIWLPDKIKSEKAEKEAESHGLLFVHDDCALRRGRSLLKV